MDREDKQTKKQQPLDAKLLSDAVIELNISRRSVGLYPPEHPIARQSILQAHDLLRKLFEIRHSITMGVAKDVLMVDEYTLDRKNPVYVEFALALHSRGIASVTFSAGLEVSELLLLHQLISNPDLPPGKALLDLEAYKKLRHVRLVPVDVSRFRFVEDGERRDEVSRHVVWEDYVYGILEGTLADKDAEGVFLSIPPDELASIISSYPSDADEGYDRVITKYLRRKGHEGLTRESLDKFLELVENMHPGVKEQFLSRAMKHPLMNSRENEAVLRDLSPGDIERVMHILQGEAALPESLRNLIDKLSEVRGKKEGGDRFDGREPRFDDVELSDQVVELFQEDRFWDFVDTQYQKDLEKILRIRGATGTQLSPEDMEQFSPAVLDSEFSAMILELIHVEDKKDEEHVNLLSKVRELADMFLETGRLEDLYKIYTVFRGKVLTGRFGKQNRDFVEGYFDSGEFITRLLEAFAIWGREHREAAGGLAKAFRKRLIGPLFDTLHDENRPEQRKFYISVLTGLGRDSVREAVRRMDSEKWFMVRNMIYIIRECGGAEYTAKIRPLTNHRNTKISFEAIKTLVHFKAPDAIARLKALLSGKSPYLREQTIRLIGTYKVGELIPDLLDILRRPDPLGSEQHFKPLVIQSLGKIGNPSVLKSLEGLFTSRSLLYKGAQKQLRLEIIRSLRNYPADKAGRILRLATSSGDKQIRTAAERAASRMGNV